MSSISNLLTKYYLIFLYNFFDYRVAKPFECLLFNLKFKILGFELGIGTKMLTIEI